MGDDDLSVVNGQLQVHGVSNLRICDTSVLPSVTRGNTMAPAIVVGERMSAAREGKVPVEPRNAVQDTCEVGIFDVLRLDALWSRI